MSCSRTSLGRPLITAGDFTHRHLDLESTQYLRNIPSFSGTYINYAAVIKLNATMRVCLNASLRHRLRFQELEKALLGNVRFYTCWRL